MNAKRLLYEVVLMPITLYVAETSNIGLEERMGSNVMLMSWLRSLWNIT